MVTVCYASTASYFALRWLCLPLAENLASVGDSLVTGRMTALPYSSYFYCFNYYGLLTGVMFYSMNLWNFRGVGIGTCYGLSGVATVLAVRKVRLE